jgi:hypothetical protein
VRALVVLAVLAAPAHANEIARDPPPPPSAPVVRDPPREQAFGLRFGFANTQVRDRDRAMIVTGLQWSVTLHRKLRGTIDYDLLMVMSAGGDAEPAMPVHGRGHAVRAGGRLAVIDKTLDAAGRLYIELETSGGLMYLAENELGRSVQPAAMAGVRLGYELFTKDRSLSRMFGGYLAFRALVTERDVGASFVVGMDWGR